MADIIFGIKIPDSKIAQEAAELVRQHETEMLFNHSVRVFVFGTMKGTRQNLKFDPELLYVAALFHDLGLVDAYHIETRRLNEPMQRANFLEVVASPSQRRIWSGKQSPCTPRPAFPIE
jgi:HD superfamily phosphodiesterase